MPMIDVWIYRLPVKYEKSTRITRDLCAHFLMQSFFSLSIFLSIHYIPQPTHTHCNGKDWAKCSICILGISNIRKKVDSDQFHSHFIHILDFCWHFYSLPYSNALLLQLSLLSRLQKPHLSIGALQNGENYFILWVFVFSWKFRFTDRLFFPTSTSVRCERNSITVSTYWIQWNMTLISDSSEVAAFVRYI